VIFGFGFGGVFQSSKIEKWLIIIGIGVREKAIISTFLIGFAGCSAVYQISAQ